jgi:acyl-CoA reductase-like NAD-dependent aldehyde dehydrogenase
MSATTVSALPVIQRVRQNEIYIGGRWQKPARGGKIPVFNPATASVIAEVGEAGPDDVNAAVAAARKAFDSGPWPRMTPRERERILFRIAELIEQHAEELAQLEALDVGKPISEARLADIPLSAEFFRYFGGWISKLQGATIPVNGRFLNYTVREPIGVVAAITPWNFPLALSSQKLAPALATGNTVIHKPAEQTPLTALRFAELAEEAGLPEGVLSVLPGYGETTGATLVRHPGVDKIAFTGETTTGKEIMRNGADTLKRLSLELGGKSPNIVFADADFEAAANGAIAATFFNQGEICSAGSRMLVERAAYDRMVEAVAKRAKSLTVGDPMSSHTQMGAQVSKEQYEKVLRYIAIGRDEGATVVCGGAPYEAASTGWFVQPTVFSDVGNEMRIARDEIFGPVVAIIPFSEPEEAVEIGNATSYGLAAGVWTRDIGKAHRVASELKAGTVWVNTYNMFDVASPFGGYKQSGFGRENGVYAIENYSQIKSVWVSLD